MTTDYFALGYAAFPNHYGKPKPCTDAEIQFCKGWMKAQSEQNVSDSEWEFGRDTYFANYDRAPK